MSENAVDQFYSASAPDYHMQYQREMLDKTAEYPANYFRLQILVQRMASAGVKSVYEVGVGEGTPLAVMASMGFRVAGCDISSGMIDKARANFASRGLSQDLIQWGDVEDATTLAGQLSSGSFDALIAAGVLPHVRNDSVSLRNMGMLVRPGGRVFVEFRNKLFSLFTMNRYTKEFILDDLLAGVSAGVKDVVAEELDKRLATDMPPRRETIDGTDIPGYDAILSKFHNPFELLDTFRSCGFADPQLHWYHYHPAPPMLESRIGEAFRKGSRELEHEGTWRGFFLCSAGVVEAVKL